MYCCSGCFHDQEIIAFISNSPDKGKCDFCAAEGVQIIDPRELEEMFQPVVGLFRTVSSLGITVPHSRLMHQKMQDLWKLFNLPETAQQSILSAILSDSLSPDDILLNEPVEIEAHFSNAAAGDVHEKKWQTFAEEIKFKNRFFLTETIDLDLLSQMLNWFSKEYQKGKIFYRARVSDGRGFQLEEMGKPPADKTTPGRANPKGIPYLYLSTKLETTLYESRSTYLDFISVAEFKLTGPLSVVSLCGIHDVSPFAFKEQLPNYIAHQKYLAGLEQELSKPIRRFDKELDYLPSQYLCEYVKSLGYDAIEYSSSLKRGGINLAVFEDSKLSPKCVNVYEITQLDLGISKVI